MPVPFFNEAIYPEVEQWLVMNPQDKHLPKYIKLDLLRFKTLTEAEKGELKEALFAIPELPEVLQQFMPNCLGKLPCELANKIAVSLESQDFNELTQSSKQIHFLFKGEAFDVLQHSKIFAKFLECVAYGQQDKAEKLLSQVFHGKPAKIQAALLHQGKFTDYSGRTFNCSAYEYAYWAKDTYMCRMLEQYMDDETKAQMLVRIDAIDATGLPYQQNGEEHRSAHFDFQPLKNAYEDYDKAYIAWYQRGDWDGLVEASMNIGKAQRNVPAHVAQEYCRSDRLFDSTSEFKEEMLLRVFNFNNWTIDKRDDSWFPLAAPNSGLGFNFLFIRRGKGSCARTGGGANFSGATTVREDSKAVSYLDKVRTADLTQLREHLNSPAFSVRRF